MNKGRSLLLVLGVAITFQSAMADRRSDRIKSYPAIYPFVAAELNSIYGDVKKVTEDVDFIKNFNEIEKQKLSKARTTVKPWTASYWPLSKGTIADPFEKSSIPYYVDWSWVDWERNYKGFKKRYKKVLSRVDDLSEEELSQLAPSEKYDLLLGDKSFDLTKRLWEYMKAWGSKKQHGFISELLLVGEDSLTTAEDYISKGWYQNTDDAFANSWNLKGTLAAEKALKLVADGKYENATAAFTEALEIAQVDAKNYVLEKKNSRIAAWEGICNGWSTAAGLVPRPRKAVSIKLKNGKNLKFYPSDIKGLVSLYYVNSLVQDNAYVGENDGLPYTVGTVSAGLRCNLKKAKKDIWGRKYDSKDDPSGKNAAGKRDVRCNGVHPATWHLGLVNLIGKQGRSFIVERKVGAAVDNHPMYKYKMKYFNPNSGRSKKKLEQNIERIDKNDQFKQFRNAKAKYIVGVETVVTYMDYDKPKRQEKNSEKDDKEVDKKMLYDLELDADYNIVGGQWRALKVGEAPARRSGSVSKNKRRLNNNQPDFFWLITKGYKRLGWFDNENLAPWKDKSVAPPTSWVTKAHSYHSFDYKMDITTFLPTCRMLDKRTKKYKNVHCSQSYNKPQPLINVINGLVNLAK